MIYIDDFEVQGFDHAIRGMRNPMNSWEKNDSSYCSAIRNDDCEKFMECVNDYCIGKNDLSLAQKLSKGGDVHAKYLRMIVVWVDITAPLYWWKEFDTYKVGTVANSCSTMHKLTHKEFELDDFSHDKMNTFALECLERYTIPALNVLRDHYLTEKDPVKKKEEWYSMIQTLPSSYNQKRTVMLNYQVLKSIYWSRKDHKLEEWRDFCDWASLLPWFTELCVDPLGEETK